MTGLVLFTVTYVVDLLIDDEQDLLIDASTGRRTSVPASGRGEPGPSPSRLRSAISGQASPVPDAGPGAQDASAVAAPRAWDLVVPHPTPVPALETDGAPAWSPACCGWCPVTLRDCGGWVVYGGPRTPRRRGDLPSPLSASFTAHTRPTPLPRRASRLGRRRGGRTRGKESACGARASRRHRGGVVPGRGGDGAGRGRRSRATSEGGVRGLQT